MEERFLRYDRLFLKIHGYISLAFFLIDLLYLRQNFMSQNYLMWGYRAIILFGFFSRLGLHFFKYLGQKRLFFFFNNAMIFFLCFIFFDANPFLHMIGLTSIGISHLESIIQKNVMTVRERQALFVYVIIPSTLSLLVTINIIDFSVLALGLWLLLNLILIAVTIFVTANDWDRLESLREKERLIKKYRYERESLTLEKFKHERLIEQVTQNKQEIEEKNLVLKRVSAEMFTQTELLKYISSVLEMKELMSLVTDSIIGATGVDTCMLVIYDQESGDQYFRVRTNQKLDLERQFKQDVQKGLYDGYFEANAFLLDARVRVEDYPFLSNRQVGSLIIVPLVRNGLTYGLLINEHLREGMFDQNTVNFLKSITNQINIAIHNANLYKSMAYLANRDGLTGLFNRRYLQEYIDSFIEDYDEDEPETLVLALYDVDFFKKINDHYGHLFGDQVLKGMGQLAADFAGEYEGLAARYGGEEFIFVFENRPLEEVHRLMEAFHERIKEERFFHEASQKDVLVNVSMGISTFPSTAHTVDQLLGEADAAMYEAKEKGRGQIVLYRQ